MNIKIIDVPDLSIFQGSNFFETIENFLSFIYSLFHDLVTAIYNFYNALIESNTYVTNLINSAQNGNINGLPVLNTVGCYRYLIGDPIFYLTYMLVLFGCMFTIYKLILLLIKNISSWKNSLTSGTFTSGGLTAKIIKLFK